MSTFVFTKPSPPVTILQQDVIGPNNKKIDKIELLVTDTNSVQFGKYIEDIKIYIKQLINFYFDEDFLNQYNVNKEQLIEFYTKTSSIKTLLISFTDQTFKLKDNFETLEYVGDTILRYIIPKLIIEMNVGRSQSYYSQFYMLLTSKPHQARTSRALGLHLFARTMSLENGTDNIAGDIFESFVGAFSTIGNEYSQNFGLILTEYFLKGVYNKFILEKSNVAESELLPHKTRIQQIFGKDEIIELQYEYSTNHVTVIMLNSPRIFEFMGINYQSLNKMQININTISKNDEVIVSFNEKENNYGKTVSSFDDIKKNVNDNIKHGKILLGYSISTTKASATNYAYYNSMENVEKLGVTVEKLKDQKEHANIVSSWGGLGYSQLDVKNMYEKYGIKKLKFITYSKTSTKKTTLVQLIEEKINGDYVILNTMNVLSSKDRGENKVREAETALLGIFASTLIE